MWFKRKPKEVKPDPFAKRRLAKAKIGEYMLMDGFAPARNEQDVLAYIEYLRQRQAKVYYDTELLH